VDTDRDREGWFWIITSALVVAIVAALHAFGASGPSSVKTSTVETAMSAPLPAKDAIDVPRPTPQASPARPADARIATVFECRVSGQRIYSDHRCGSKADERPIQAPNRMDAQDTSILSSPDAVLARSRSERANTQEPVVDSARSECDWIEQQKNLINARMREGYGSPEGERLRDRLRVLGARYYDLRCRHFH
jgi:hypothetical protein